MRYDAFKFQQKEFCFQAASKSGQTAIGPDDAMTGNDDRQRVAAIGGAYRSYYPALKAHLAAQGTVLPSYVEREFEA